MYKHYLWLLNSETSSVSLSLQLTAANMIAAFYFLFAASIPLVLCAPLDIPIYHCPTDHAVLKCCAGYDKVVFPESCTPGESPNLMKPTSAPQLINTMCTTLVTRVFASYNEFWQTCMYADEKNNGGHVPGCCQGENVSHVLGDGSSGNYLKRANSP